MKLPLLKDFIVFSSFQVNVHVINFLRGTPENQGGKRVIFLPFLGTKLEEGSGSANLLFAVELGVWR